MALTTLTTLALVAGLASGVSQIAGGASASQAANAQAKLQEEQGKIALDEANREAERKGVERRRFLAEQRMAYLASGVDLSGTPGIVQSDTFKEFQMEIDALRRSGVAHYSLYRRQAAITRSTGRAKLTSGILSGIGIVGLSSYGALKGD